jgi:predicted RNA-binding protein with RPS1 domain
VILTEDLEMKFGTRCSKQIDEITAYRLLKELYEKRSKNQDGKVHIHEIKDGHIGEEIENF